VLAGRLTREFPDKNWIGRKIKKIVEKVAGSLYNITLRSRNLERVQYPIESSIMTVNQSIITPIPWSDD